MGGTHPKLKDKHLTIIPRTTWGARKALHQDPQKLPVNEVVFSSVKFKFPYWDTKLAYKGLRDMQLFHIYQRYMPDIQYNFMIDEKGTIYEGRGWFWKPSPNPGDLKANLKSFYVAYIGQISEEGPTDDMMKSGNDLLSFGMRHEYIKYHHHIRGQITGIVGTTLEDCLRRQKGLPSESEDEGVKPRSQQAYVPLEQFYM